MEIRRKTVDGSGNDLDLIKLEPDLFAFLAGIEAGIGVGLGKVDGSVTMTVTVGHGTGKIGNCKIVLDKGYSLDREIVRIGSDLTLAGMSPVTLLSSICFTLTEGE